MQISLSFIRILFLGLCILFATTYTTAEAKADNYPLLLAIGAGAGIAFWAILISLDRLFKAFNLHSFNIATLGLLFGYCMGEAIMLVFQNILTVTLPDASLPALPIIRMMILVLATYLGMIMTARAADQLAISIPFIRFKPSTQKKKDLLIDTSVLLDSRIIDLATSGLLDHHLVLPRFLSNELNEMAESSDEALRTKARRCQEVIKKLESLPSLELRYTDADFPECKDSMSKLIRTARLLDANIITADASRLQQPSIEGVRLINIHMLSTALKPMTQAGEFINIKIQRYGKEPRQGIGYLDDGTMVVVNGGAEFIGETIRAQVLSVKHTASGRMIFCNALEENMLLEPALSGMSSDLESSAKNYFAL